MAAKPVTSALVLFRGVGWDVGEELVAADLSLLAGAWDTAVLIVF